MSDVRFTRHVTINGRTYIFTLVFFSFRMCQESGCKSSAGKSGRCHAHGGTR